MKLKPILLSVFFQSILNLLSAQTSQNMTLLANWDDPTIPTTSFGDQYSDCWGYADETGEYAIMGSSKFIHVFNVTNPSNPVEVLRYDGGTNTAWREFRTYSHYLYCVTDATNEGLRIFDLSNLPAAPVQVYSSTAFFSRCHTIHVDSVAGRLYCAGTNTRSNGLIVLDIATNPASPTQLASVTLTPGAYVHDCYVRDNKVYASHGNNGLYVWDFTTPTAPILLGSMTTYVEKGYNHSSWMNVAGTHLVMTDETNNTGVKMVRVSDLSDIIVTDTFRSTLLAPAATNSIAHNPCVRGSFVYLSYYHDGIQVWDISNPSDVQRVGYYDTYTTNTNYNSYFGPWGVYPYLPSGNIIGSDMRNGLYVLGLSSNCRPPTTTTFASVTANSAKVDWNDIPSATKYRFRYRKVGTTPWTVVTMGNANVSYKYITNLEPGSQYQVQVGSNCPYGWTNYAQFKNFTTLNTGVCQIPAAGWVTNLGPNTATINWNAVAGAIGYSVNYRKLGTTTWANKYGTTTNRTLTNLLPNKTYEYRLSSRCGSYQYSPYNAVQTFTTPPLAMPAPETEERAELGNLPLEISIFPNPVSDELHVQLNLETAVPGLKVEIFDANGEAVESETFDEENHMIFDISHLPSGTYACRVKAGEAVRTEKFVKI